MNNVKILKTDCLDTLLKLKPINVNNLINLITNSIEIPQYILEFVQFCGNNLPNAKKHFDTYGYKIFLLLDICYMNACENNNIEILNWLDSKNLFNKIDFSTCLYLSCKNENERLIDFFLKKRINDINLVLNNIIPFIKLKHFKQIYLNKKYTNIINNELDSLNGHLYNSCKNNRIELSIWIYDLIEKSMYEELINKLLTLLSNKNYFNLCFILMDKVKQKYKNNVILHKTIKKIFKNGCKHNNLSCLCKLLRNYEISNNLLLNGFELSNNIDILKLIFFKMELKDKSKINNFSFKEKQIFKRVFKEKFLDSCINNNYSIISWLCYEMITSPVIKNPEQIFFSKNDFIEGFILVTKFNYFNTFKNMYQLCYLLDLFNFYKKETKQNLVNKLFEISCLNNCFEIAKYIYSQKNINKKYINWYEIIFNASDFNYIDIFSWLLNLNYVDKNINLRRLNDYIFKNACKNNHIEIAKLLVKKFDFYKIKFLEDNKIIYNIETIYDKIYNNKIKYNKISLFNFQLKRKKCKICCKNNYPKLKICSNNHFICRECYINQKSLLCPECLNLIEYKNVVLYK